MVFCWDCVEVRSRQIDGIWRSGVQEINREPLVKLTLPSSLSLYVFFCVLVTYTALAGSFGHTHTFDDLHDVIYFVNVPEGYRIRITFLDKEVVSLIVMWWHTALVLGLFLSSGSSISSSRMQLHL